MKKKVIILCAVLLLALSAVEPMDISARSSSITSQSIKEKEQQISQAEKEKEQMEGLLTNLQKVKKELEAEKTNLKNYVAQLDNSLSEIESNIADLKARISTKESEIEQTGLELEAALSREENQKEFIHKSIKLLYERSDTYMVELLMQAQSFGDFLNRAGYIENVITYEQKMWDEYIENRQLIELCKQELELEKQILDQAKANVEQEQANLQALIQQKNQDIVAYETDISNKEQAIKEYEQAIKEQDAEIEALEAAIAEEKRQIIASNGNVITYDGGQFKFPLASYTRISDDYGMRMHPTLHIEKFHNGVDFAAPKGTAIYAAYDGKVVASTYSSTMGNYVMIDHGDSLYTIYMHASALYVEKGDIVVRGETIAGVGTTGRSTGNHLHFGVRKNGDYVSPWNYLSE